MRVKTMQSGLKTSKLTTESTLGFAAQHILHSKLWASELHLPLSCLAAKLLCTWVLLFTRVLIDLSIVSQSVATLAC